MAASVCTIGIMQLSVCWSLSWTVKIPQFVETTKAI